jgi:hypothetical protein
MLKELTFHKFSLLLQLTVKALFAHLPFVGFSFPAEAQTSNGFHYLL